MVQVFMKFGNKKKKNFSFFQIGYVTLIFLKIISNMYLVLDFN